MFMHSYEVRRTWNFIFSCERIREAFGPPWKVIRIQGLPKDSRNLVSNQRRQPTRRKPPSFLDGQQRSRLGERLALTYLYGALDEGELVLPDDHSWVAISYVSDNVEVWTPLLGFPFPIDYGRKRSRNLESIAIAFILHSSIFSIKRILDSDICSCAANRKTFLLCKTY